MLTYLKLYFNFPSFNFQHEKYRQIQSTKKSSLESLREFTSVKCKGVARPKSPRATDLEKHILHEEARPRTLLNHCVQ